MLPQFKFHVRESDNYTIDYERSHPHSLVVVSVDVETETGMARSYELQSRDDSIPMTPQSGVSCYIGDIAFMSRNNMAVQHGQRPDGVVIASTDPLASGRIMRSAAKSWELHFENQVKKSSKKS